MCPPCPRGVPERLRAAGGSLISEEDAERWASQPPSVSLATRILKVLWSAFRPADWAEQIIDRYKAKYTDIEFGIVDKGGPNGQAKFRAGGTPYVELTRALLDHPTLRREGLALALAHEVAHHVAGGKGTVACEGEADYRAVTTVMPAVWSSTELADMIGPAIEQLDRFYKAVVRDGLVAGPVACSDHPPRECRIATYREAVAKMPKPGCAS
jgi:hypothetical protein